MTSAQRDINPKLRVFEHVQSTGNVSKTGRYFWISHTVYHDFRRAYKEKGETGLINQKPYSVNPKLRTPPEVEEKILYTLW